MKSNLFVCQADSKTSPGTDHNPVGFWERHMIANHVFSVTGSHPNKERSALNQIDRLHQGDIIVANRNLGNKGGYTMFTSALSGASAPEQYEVINGVVQYYREVKVGPWHLLPEVLTHAEVNAYLGTNLIVIQTVNKINAPLDDRLFAFIFRKMFGI